MGFTNIKNKSQGFTIVELLIVVVVIAILAAITIVSYNGITNRANAAAAKSTASTMQKKAELYYSEEGRYPVSAAELSADTTKSYYITNANITPASAAPTPTSGKTRVQVISCGNATPTSANVTGMRITYYNFDTPGTVDITLGTCTTPGTTGAPTAWNGPALT